MTTAYAQVAITKRGTKIKVTIAGPTGSPILLGYYDTVEEVLADVSTNIEVVNGVLDLSDVVPPILPRAHHYETET